MIKVFTENGRTGFRSFLCVSYLAFLLLGAACMNNQQTGDQVAAVAATQS